ncbi:uncharacterized protein An01g14830 [Aspergillus niger]|uniref:Contig An01c0470, genomic contig n=2 Tax=Aspergillus niger TaxID=5061 RepID=A2QBD2_ASPNC|nr:uncharacterized protein An01g14830 [Aspergillus niger]CAK44180.1 unnamed protein product [Aspergillus niger]
MSRQLFSTFVGYQVWYWQLGFTTGLVAAAYLHDQHPQQCKRNLYVKCPT